MCWINGTYILDCVALLKLVSAGDLQSFQVNDLKESFVLANNESIFMRAYIVYEILDLNRIDKFEWLILICVIYFKNINFSETAQI